MSEKRERTDKKSLAEVWRSMPDKERKLILRLAAVLCIGIILMRFSGWGTDSSRDKNTAAQGETQAAIASLTGSTDLEKELADILSKVKGAGTVSVAVYYSESAEQIYAMETQSSESRSSSADNSSVDSQTTQTLAMSNEQPVAVKEYAARVSGVVVVSEGAGDSLVKERLYLAVKSLLGLSAGQVAIIEGEGME